jgi:hypothetical protein
MRGLLALFGLLYATTAPAADTSDPDFKPNPAAFTKTKNTSNCGGDTPDLRAELPPIEDQMHSSWCASFTEKTMLEYRYHQLHPKDKYATRFSVVDINSKDSLMDEAAVGMTPNLAGGASIMQLLEGAQGAGELLREADWPFEPEYFNPGGQVAQLTEYYQHMLPYAEAKALQCRDLSPTNLQLEKDFSNILQALQDSYELDDFVSKVTQENPIYPAPHLWAKSVPIKPPLFYRSFRAREGDQYLEELRSVLQQHQPAAIEICGIQMEKISGLGAGPIPPALDKKCGRHQILVSRLLTVNGKCMVELRNSWGTAWPYSADRGSGGYGLVSLDELLHLASPEKDGGFGVVSLKDPKSPDAGNTAEEAGWTFTGSTLAGNPYDGKFTGQKVDSGYFYDGEIRIGVPSGKGHQIKDDGADLQGEFSDGKLVSGSYKGPWNGKKNLNYDGPILNGKPTTAGHWTDASGKIVTPP